MSTVGGLQSKERNLFPFEGLLQTSSIVSESSMWFSYIPDDDEQVLRIFIIEIGGFDALD